MGGEKRVGGERGGWRIRYVCRGKGERGGEGERTG